MDITAPPLTISTESLFLNIDLTGKVIEFRVNVNGKIKKFDYHIIDVEEGILFITIPSLAVGVYPYRIYDVVSDRVVSNGWLYVTTAASGTAIDASTIADGSVNNTEFQYLNGVTSPLQTQINNLSLVSVANQGNDRVVTSTATTDALNAEANLTFDGTTLTITSATKVATMTATGTQGFSLKGQAGTGWINGYSFLGSAGTYGGSFGAYGVSDTIDSLYIGRDNTDRSAKFFMDGGAELYYDNALKLATYSAGVGITGNIVIDNSAGSYIYKAATATDVAGRYLMVQAGATVAGTAVDNVAGGALYLDAGLGTGTGTSNIYFRTGTTLTTGKTLQTLSTKMTILGNGYVGIGTIAPTANLHVVSAIATTYSTIISNTDANGYGLRLSTGGTAVDRPVFYAVGGSGIGFYVGGNNKVGIGTTTPLTELQVAGRISSSATGTTPASGAHAMLLYNTAGDYGQLFSWNYTTGVAKSLMLNPSGGNVMVGTTGGLGKFSINGGLHVGGDSDAGDNNLLVDGTCGVTGISTFTGLIKTVGGLHVGGTSDPGTDNLLVDGTAEVTGASLFTGLVKTVGGVHVGGTSDPGTDNLTVDGTTITNLLKITNGAVADYYWKCTNVDGAGAWAAITASQVYKGTIDGDTGVPTIGGSALIDGTGTAGWYYRCVDAGTYDYGNPSGNSIVLAVGDDIFYNGTIWQAIPGAGYDLQIASGVVLGGVMIGTGVDINGSGVISVAYGTTAATACVGNDARLSDPRTPSAHTLDSHSNVTITSNSDGELLRWNGSAWINNTLTEANIQTLHTNLTSISALSYASTSFVKMTGEGTFGLDASAYSVLTGSTATTLVTVTGANAIQGENNLTFDGTLLTVGGTRPVVIDSTNGQVYAKGVAGAWALGYRFIGSGATGLGGFGAFGDTDTLTNFWIGKSQTDQSVKFFVDGAVELYYDNAKKLETISTGVTVTGVVSATSTITGTQLISNIATGTAPLTVSSTTKVDNLHVARATLADTITVAASASTTGSIAFFESATGNLAIKTDPGLTYNATTNILTISGLSGTGTRAVMTSASGVLSALAPSALTRVNDTNVTLTLGGSPDGALFAATSLTLGWTGTLADARIASSANWNTAYGWGNHASAGYLTSQTSHADVVQDGDFTSQGIMLRGASSGVYSILTNNSTNWNTAYGWGNHASAGYLTSVTAHVLDSATHTISGKTAGQVLLATAATTYAFTALSGDVTINGSGVTAIGTNKVTLAMMAQVNTARILGRVTGASGNVESMTGTQATTILDLFATTATTKGLVPGSNNVGATYFLNGAGAWATVGSSHALSTHSDVTITSIDAGELLKWSGTAWINNTLAEAGIQSGHANLTSLSTLSYTSTAFVKMTASNTFALEAGSFIVGSGIAKITVGDTEPVGAAIGDLWIDTSF